MAVKLRLKRMGAKKRPYYRIVAADSRSPRDGRFIEAVGTYDPIVKENNITLDEEKVMKWLKTGAEPTDTVKSILSNAGVWKKFKAEASAPKPKVKKEVEAKPAAKPAAKKEATTKPAAKKTTAAKPATKKAPAKKKEA